MMRMLCWVGRGAIPLVLITLCAAAAGNHPAPIPAPSRHATRAAVLDALAISHSVVVAGLLASLGLAAAGLLVGRRAGRTVRGVLARVALAATATLLVLGVVDVATAVYLSWLHHAPRLAMRNGPPRPASTDNMSIVVVGESSAEGVPYRDWTSVGKIVTWQLRRIFPQRMFHLEVQARAGWTLEAMQQKLAESRQRPDAVILYAGHNEFAMRYGWSWDAPHYLDTPAPWWVSRPFSTLTDWSSLCRFLKERRDLARVAAPPPSRQCSLVDVPSFTAAQYQERLEDFERRVAMILEDLKAAEVLTIVIIPPGNDAGFEPDRSVLPAETPRAGREAFATAFQEARDLEAIDPSQSMARYRSLIAQQPGFAESHFRLARLLQAAHEPCAAYQEYVASRDLDGHPMRCLTAFQDVYRRLAPQYGAVLIDGQEVLHAKGPAGLLDDHLFNDGMHPSLQGQVALAQATLAALKARGAFQWPATLAVPVVSPEECADHFDITLAAWKEVCRFAAGFYRATSRIRFDPAERAAKEARYESALRRLEAGEAPERLELPGIGVRR